MSLYLFSPSLGLSWGGVSSCLTCYHPNTTLFLGSSHPISMPAVISAIVIFIFIFFFYHGFKILGDTDTCSLGAASLRGKKKQKLHISAAASACAVLDMAQVTDKMLICQPPGEVCVCVCVRERERLSLREYCFHADKLWAELTGSKAA